MNPAGAVVFFVVSWWLAFFLALPFGIRTPEEMDLPPRDGLPRGVPHRPRLWLKAGVATAVASVLLLIFWLVQRYDLIRLRDFFDR